MDLLKDKYVVFVDSNSKGESIGCILGKISEDNYAIQHFSIIDGEPSSIGIFSLSEIKERCIIYTDLDHAKDYMKQEIKKLTAEYL
jgi:hypothetical protein